MQPIGAQAGFPGHYRRTNTDCGIGISSDPVLGLRRYDEERRPIMNEIVLRNRQFGPGSIVTAGRRAGAEWL